MFGVSAKNVYGKYMVDFSFFLYYKFLLPPIDCNSKLLIHSEFPAGTGMALHLPKSSGFMNKRHAYAPFIFNSLN